MASLKPRTVPYRRRREGRTNYKKRLSTLISMPLRLVVRFTNKKIIAQLIEFKPAGDVVLATVSSEELSKKGWPYSCKNIPAAYLTGFLFAKSVKGKEDSQIVLDAGSRSPSKKGKVYAFLKGVLDGGLKIPAGENIFPSAERLSGKHIADHSALLKKNGAESSLFTQYLKKNASAELMVSTFEKVKKSL